jgi:predicted secreted hydrolase
MRLRFQAVFVWIMVALLLTACAGTASSSEVRSGVVLPDAGSDVTGYARVTQSRDFVWPADHGPHDAFLLEWWYYTGNVVDKSGRPFGYQLTIFRRALAPPNALVPTPVSNFAFNQLYFAHFAVSDVQANKHYAFERYARGAAGLSGAQAEPFRAWINDWQMLQQPVNTAQKPAVEAARDAAGDVTLTARDGDVSINLTLATQKPPTLHGDDGYSVKGKRADNASHYYSFSRMATTGSISLGGETFDVSGSSWMDHEWSTSLLDEDSAGWDWLSLQLDDDTDLMVAQVRGKAGGPPAALFGTLIGKDGVGTPLTRDMFSMVSSGGWTSPRSQITYQNRWQINVPSAQLVLDVSPRFDDQEAKLSSVYYEGAMTASGTRAGKPLTGVGYLEVTWVVSPR